MDSKYVQQFKKGSLEMILLCLISQKETYGYEIMENLNKSGSEVWGYAKEGTVYPILYRMQDAGLIKSRSVTAGANGGQKKYYSVTQAGSQTLGELIEFWKRYSKYVDGIIEKSLNSEEKQ